MRKRQSPLRLIELEIESGRSVKRCRVSKDASGCLDCVLPLQPEQDLGPFWVTTGRFDSLQAQFEAAACSLGSWGVKCQASLTFAVPSSMSRGCADIDDADTQDTATSSGSEGCERAQQYAPGRKPRTAATGEEDSITSRQPVPAASVAFSFGTRPYLTPDLTEVHCWDIMNDLIAAV